MIFNGHNLKGLLKLSLCLTTALLLASCSTTAPSREVAGQVAGNESTNDEKVGTEYDTAKEVANRPAFTQKRLKSNDMY